MTKKSAVRKRFLPALLCLGLGGAAAAGDLRLAVPKQMAESGFLNYLLPRFKLKHRIAVLPVAPDAEAEMALSGTASGGTPVFADADGATYRLSLLAASAEAEKFRDWLQSDPGRAAITGFPPGGPSAYVTDLAVEAVVQAPEVTGDAALGAMLALRHCGRCHVVDRRNRMGGIGSTPSFRRDAGAAALVQPLQRLLGREPAPELYRTDRRHRTVQRVQGQPCRAGADHAGRP